MFASPPKASAPKAASSRTSSLDQAIFALKQKPPKEAEAKVHLEEMIDRISPIAAFMHCLDFQLGTSDVPQNSNIAQWLYETVNIDKVPRAKERFKKAREEFAERAFQNISEHSRKNLIAAAAQSPNYDKIINAILANHAVKATERMELIYDILTTCEVGNLFLQLNAKTIKAVEKFVVDNLAEEIHLEEKESEENLAAENPQRSLLHILRLRSIIVDGAVIGTLDDFLDCLEKVDKTSWRHKRDKSAKEVSEIACDLQWLFSHIKPLEHNSRIDVILPLVFRFDDLAQELKISHLKFPTDAKQARLIISTYGRLDYNVDNLQHHVEAKGKYIEEAKFKLWLNYYYGLTVPEDYDQAKKWEQSLREHDIVASPARHFGYHEGKQSKAFSLCHVIGTWKAHEANYFISKYSSYDLAKSHRESLDDRHYDAWGHYLLGKCYYENLNGYPRDPFKAFEYFQLAHWQGIWRASLYLVECYQLGRGVQANLLNATKIIRQVLPKVVADQRIKKELLEKARQISKVSENDFLLKYDLAQIYISLGEMANMDFVAKNPVMYVFLVRNDSFFDENTKRQIFAVRDKEVFEKCGYKLTAGVLKDLTKLYQPHPAPVEEEKGEGNNMPAWVTKYLDFKNKSESDFIIESLDDFKKHLVTLVFIDECERQHSAGLWRAEKVSPAINPLLEALGRSEDFDEALIPLANFFLKELPKADNLAEKILQVIGRCRPLKDLFQLHDFNFAKPEDQKLIIARIKNILHEERALVVGPSVKVGVGGIQ